MPGIRFLTLAVASAAAIALAAAPVSAAAAAVGGSVTAEADLGPLTRLEFVAAPTSTIAGYYTVFAVNGLDAEGDALGDVSSDAVFTTDSTAPYAIVDGTSVRMILAGPTIVTATIGDVSGTTALTVEPDVITLGGEEQSASTDSIAGKTVTLVFDAFDQYFNHVADISATSTYASSVAADRVSGNSVRFMTGGGLHDVTVVGSGIDYHWLMSVAKDTPKLSAALPKSLKAGKTSTVKLSLKSGAGKLKPTGTVRVYYGKKYVTAKFPAGSASTATVKLPKLKKGTYALHLKYFGSTAYVTAVTATVKVRSK